MVRLGGSGKPQSSRMRRCSHCALALEMKSVQGVGCAGREKMQRVAFGFGLEKLPGGAHLHEFGGFVFYRFHALEKLDGFGIALRETLFKIAAESEMAAKEHERINVAPDFAEVGNETNFAVEILHRRDGNIGAHSG